VAERGVSLYRRTCDRSLLPICCPRPFQVSHFLEMLRKTAGVVVGLSNRQATDTSICRYFEDGSDGTRTRISLPSKCGLRNSRTRDLRRDRPVRARPAQLAATRNYRLEQALPNRANRS
jgi:hypothetical protein